MWPWVVQRCKIHEKSCWSSWRNWGCVQRYEHQWQEDARTPEKEDKQAAFKLANGTKPKVSLFSCLKWSSFIRKAINSRIFTLIRKNNYNFYFLPAGLVRRVASRKNIKATFSTLVAVPAKMKKIQARLLMNWNKFPKKSKRGITSLWLIRLSTCLNWKNPLHPPCVLSRGKEKKNGEKTSKY